jgi:hypothetical protein
LNMPFFVMDLGSYIVILGRRWLAVMRQLGTRENGFDLSY